MTAPVLVAVDPQHPESWAKALPEAVALASARKTGLQLCGIIPDYGLSIVTNALPKGWEEQALQDCKQRLEAIAAEHVGDAVAWETQVGHGDVSSEILRIATEKKAQVIVMASNPPNALRQFLLGSQAERVVHHAPVSVFVVRG